MKRHIIIPRTRLRRGAVQLGVILVMQSSKKDQQRNELQHVARHHAADRDAIGCVESIDAELVKVLVQPILRHLDDQARQDCRRHGRRGCETRAQPRRADNRTGIRKEQRRCGGNTWVGCELRTQTERCSPIERWAPHKAVREHAGLQQQRLAHGEGADAHRHHARRKTAAAADRGLCGNDILRDAAPSPAERRHVRRCRAVRPPLRRRLLLLRLRLHTAQQRLAER